MSTKQQQPQQPIYQLQLPTSRNTTITNNAPKQQQQQQTSPIYLTSLFFKIFTNESLREGIIKHVWSDRSVFSKNVSYKPLVYQRYHSLNSAEWICKNGYFNLLLDKIKCGKPLIFTPKAIDLLCGYCRDMNIFTYVFREKREYFFSAGLIERACETGNLEVVKFLLSTSLWNLNLACMELAVCNNHVETVQFIHHQSSVSGNPSGSFQLLLSTPYSSSPSSSPTSSSTSPDCTYSSPMGSPVLHSQIILQHQATQIFSSPQSPPYNSHHQQFIPSATNNNNNQPQSSPLQKQSVSIPHLFTLALQKKSIKVAQFLFDRIGFFLTSSIDGMFKNLCLCGDLAFFKRIYESFKLVFATGSIKEYHSFLIGLLDYQENPITHDHFKIIEYIERDSRVSIPPLKPNMTSPQLYSLYIRWAFLNKQKLINDMSNFILKSAVHLDDVELFTFSHKNFVNPHISKYLPTACQRGNLGIVHYILENRVESLTSRVIQIAYFSGHHDIIDYFKRHLQSLPLDTSYHYRKPVDWPISHYPIEILEARAQSTTDKTIDPLLALISSEEVLTPAELQSIFVRSFTDGDHSALRTILSTNLIEYVSVSKIIWQMIAKIGDIDLFEAMLGINQRISQNRKSSIYNHDNNNNNNSNYSNNSRSQLNGSVSKTSNKLNNNRSSTIYKQQQQQNNLSPSSTTPAKSSSKSQQQDPLKAIINKVAVDCSIWGQLDLLKYLITKHSLEMDQQTLEYLVNSATFNGNCHVISYLLDNFRIDKSNSSFKKSNLFRCLIKHAINYRHYDLVKLYNTTYLVPLDKKLLKLSSTPCNIDSNLFKSYKKKSKTNNNNNIINNNPSSPSSISSSTPSP